MPRIWIIQPPEIAAAWQGRKGALFLKGKSDGVKSDTQNPTPAVRKGTSAAAICGRHEEALAIAREDFQRMLGVRRKDRRSYLPVFVNLLQLARISDVNPDGGRHALARCFLVPCDDPVCFFHVVRVREGRTGGPWCTRVNSEGPWTFRLRSICG